MADKQYGWLDRETAERLLRGESLDNAVDPAARDDAERLAKTLGALSGDPLPNTAELPGEAAALAAFRKAQANRATAAAGPGRALRTDRTREATAAADHPSPTAASGLASPTAPSGHPQSADVAGHAPPTADLDPPLPGAEPVHATPATPSDHPRAATPSDHPRAATPSDHPRAAAPSGHARSAVGSRHASPGHSPAAPSGQPPSTDAGLIRIGASGHRVPRPRRRRPVRVGLVAVVAFGMVGGAVVAAATGVLPKPFGDDEPRPGASVSAAVTPDRPLVSPSSDDAAEGQPSPDRSDGASPDQGTPRTDAGGTPSADPGSDGQGRTGGFGSWWDGAPSACRDMRDGQQLSPDRRRALEGLAGGSTHVRKYCKGVLKTSDGQADREDDREDQGQDKDRDGSGGQAGDDESDDRDRGGNGHDHRQNGGLSTPSPSPSDDITPQPKRAAAVPEPSPNPSYSAL